jgi:hypothetical protein
LKTLKRDRADFGVFERYRFAVVQADGYTIHPQNLAGHVVAGDLLASVVRQEDGLEGTQSNGVKPGKSPARTEQRCAFGNAQGRCNNRFETDYRIGLQSD